jgi:tetratricopeptide (TPR) repeat protein
MSQTSAVTQSTVKKAAQKPLSWDVQLLIALTGAIASFWLASRQNAHKLPPLPTFHERFWLIAPTLLEGATGILFAIWLGLLIREAGARSTPKVVPGETAAETARKKRWTAFKWVTFVVFVLATIASFGGDYFRYLWPSYPAWVSRSAHPIFDLIALLGFFAESYNRGKKQSPQQGTGYGAERVPWLDERQKAFILFALVGIALLIGIFQAIKNLPPSSVKQIMAISLLVLAVIQVTILQAIRKPGQNPPQSDIQARSLAPGDGVERQRKWLGQAVSWVMIATVVAVMFSPAPREIKIAAFVAPIGILVAWGAALTRLRRWINGLAKEGEFDRALQMDRRYARIPGYGAPLQGLILFNAGRYPEARTFLKPFAFDELGQPRLTSTKLYLYALALENDGLEPEAQKLLEAAIQVPQQRAGFHVALATCLLSQKKDAERACELMELALATTDAQSTA